MTDTPDIALAQSWYQRAYEAGEVDGLVALAYMHRDGEFGAIDIERAFTHCSSRRPRRDRRRPA